MRTHVFSLAVAAALILGASPGTTQAQFGYYGPSSAIFGPAGAYGPSAIYRPGYYGYYNYGSRPWNSYYYAAPYGYGYGYYAPNYGYGSYGYGAGAAGYRGIYGDLNAWQQWNAINRQAAR